MNRRLFVANIPYTSTEDDLRDHFAEVGHVDDVRIIRDKGTGQSKGFGFVTMSSVEEAVSAVANLHEIVFEGRALTVREADDRPPRHESRSNRDHSHRRESRDSSRRDWRGDEIEG